MSGITHYQDCRFCDFPFLFRPLPQHLPQIVAPLLSTKNHDVEPGRYPPPVSTTTYWRRSGGVALHIVLNVDFAFHDDERGATPCKGFDTTVSICRESRAEALETGNIAQVSGRRPPDAQWTSGRVQTDALIGKTMCATCMNWTARHEFDYLMVGNLPHALAWEALLLSGSASLMLQFLDGSPRSCPDEQVAPIGDPPARTMPSNAINIRTDERQAKLRDLQAPKQLQK